MKICTRLKTTDFPEIDNHYPQSWLGSKIDYRFCHKHFQILFQRGTRFLSPQVERCSIDASGCIPFYRFLLDSPHPGFRWAVLPCSLRSCNSNRSLRKSFCKLLRGKGAIEWQINLKKSQNYLKKILKNVKRNNHNNLWNFKLLGAPCYSSINHVPMLQSGWQKWTM